MSSFIVIVGLFSLKMQFADTTLYTEKLEMANKTRSLILSLKNFNLSNAQVTALFNHLRQIPTSNLSSSGAAVVHSLKEFIDVLEKFIQEKNSDDAPFLFMTPCR